MCKGIFCQAKGLFIIGKIIKERKESLMPEQNDEKVLHYYTQQSVITDPGDYAYLFEDLPRDLPSLMRVVQGVLIFPFA